MVHNVTSGGSEVLLYASKYHDVPTVVEASARYDLKKGIEGRLGKDFMQRIKKEGFIDIGNIMSLFYAWSFPEFISEAKEGMLIFIDIQCQLFRCLYPFTFSTPARKSSAVLSRSKVFRLYMFLRMPFFFPLSLPERLKEMWFCGCIINTNLPVFTIHFSLLRILK